MKTPNTCSVPQWSNDSIDKRGVCEYHDGGQYWYSSPGYEANPSEHPVATLVSVQTMPVIELRYHNIVIIQEV